MSYDIIADVHGHGEELRSLLEDMGYSRSPGGSWRHPERTAVFVGDLCDRGPEQIGVIRTVRSMVDDGNALIVSGNHEANARAFFTMRADGVHLRKRSEANRHQHAAFLAAVGEDSPLHKEIVNWFSTLPLWLELDGFRVVHACWDERAMDVLRPHLDEGNALGEDGLHLAYTRGTSEFEALETVLKGLEIQLPKGISFKDKEGTVRKRARTRWWDTAATTFRSAAILPEDVAACLPEEDIPADLRLTYDMAKPAFFGHYWLAGEPFLTSEVIACLDFSVAKGGVLCAYRWDGEAVLSRDKMIWTTGRQPAPALSL